MTIRIDDIEKVVLGRLQNNPNIDSPRVVNLTNIERLSCIPTMFEVGHYEHENDTITVWILPETVEERRNFLLEMLKSVGKVVTFGVYNPIKRDMLSRIIRINMKKDLRVYYAPTDSSHFPVVKYWPETEFDLNPMFKNNSETFDAMKLQIRYLMKEIKRKDVIKEDDKINREIAGLETQMDETVKQKLEQISHDRREFLSFLHPKSGEDGAKNQD